jgi:di/tricarboxylate transporter
LGLNVVGITRGSHTKLAPSPGEILNGKDDLLVEGVVGQMDSLKSELIRWSELNIDQEDVKALEQLFSENIRAFEIHLSENSPFVGQTISEVGFRIRFGINVLAILRDDHAYRSNLQDRRLRAGDWLLVQGQPEAFEKLQQAALEKGRQVSSVSEMNARYRLSERLISLRVPEHSNLIGKPLRKSRLGAAVGARVLSILRSDGTHLMPEPEEVISRGDRLLVAGRLDNIKLLRSLAELEVKALPGMETSILETEAVGLMEAMLSPHTRLAGKTLRQLNFREKYGLSVLALWREGKAYRSVYLRDMALKLGDALLLHGPREKFNILGQEPDFLVLTASAQERPNFEKAKVSVTIMAAVLFPVIMGWAPIYIAAVMGAALMVLTRCLTMQEAYRAIEWKGIFLIAGMMPLGDALHSTGAAQYLANGVVTLVGPWGPWAVMFGLMLLTFLATCVIPTAALVVLMVPIILTAAADMGASPYSMMMAMAVAASASFMTPISHPANVMVMGPGGYRFADYLKVGIPLTLVVLLVAMLLIPVVWPLKL